jgi:hypothetical protein
MNRAPLPNCISGTLFLLLLITSTIGVSQSTDNGFWTSFQIEKEISKKWSVSIEQEVRLKENYTQVDELFTEIDGSYKLLPGLKASLGYRFIEKVDPEKYYVSNLRFGHRFLGELTYKYRYRSLTFVLKTQIESEYKNVYSSDKGTVPGWAWKNKFEIKYRLMRLEPYTGTELRYQFTDPRHPESNFLLNRIWIYAGVDYSLIRNHTIGVYYLLQKEWNLTNAENRYILGIQYSIILPSGKKKSKN